jgi:hypothetical protein
MYVSGLWRGYWEQAFIGRQPMHDLNLRFAEGRISGEGHDYGGAFTFVGEYDEHGGVFLLKQYIGKHQVRYFGRYDGEGTIHGHWTIDPIWSGPFALSMPKADVADLPILTIAADPFASA